MKSQREIQEELCPIVPTIDLLGIPRSGKSTLCRRLVEMLEEMGITAAHFTQDEGSDMDLAYWGLRQYQERLRESNSEAAGHQVSESYLAWLKITAARIRQMKKGVALWEHGPHFSGIMESIVNGRPAHALKKNFRGLPMPNFGIFLAITPEQIRARLETESGRILLDPELSRRIYEAMKRTAEPKHWIHIDARKDPETIAQIALRGIQERWRPFLEITNRRPKFKFPFEALVEKEG